MMRIAIVGSGFAGSILARILAIQGHRVQLLDRQRHPRFALGESSTPLAAICLERLAARYGLADPHAPAPRGRWRGGAPPPFPRPQPRLPPFPPPPPQPLSP